MVKKKHWKDSDPSNVLISYGFFVHLRKKSIPFRELMQLDLSTRGKYALVIRYDNCHYKTRDKEWFILLGLQKMPSRKRGRLKYWAGSHTHTVERDQYGKSWFITRFR